MSQLNHTPGPVRVFSPFGRPEIVTDRPTAHETQSVVTQFGQPGADSNARLIAASYNAFDSAAGKLGVNAVEFAERMAEGGISDLVQALAAAHTSLRTFRNVPPDDQQWTSLDDDTITAVECAIAKVKGGAA